MTVCSPLMCGESDGNSIMLLTFNV